MTKETIKKWLEKNPPAFPANLHGESGITIRDYFAAAAMQGLLANGAHSYLKESLPRISYDYAEMMLAEREKQ